MKNIILYISIFFTTVSVVAQNPNRVYQSHQLENGKLSVTTNDGEYIFQFYSQNTIETTFIPKGESQKKESHAVAQHTKNSDVSLKITDGGILEFIGSNSLKDCLPSNLNCNYFTTVKIQIQALDLVTSLFLE